MFKQDLVQNRVRDFVFPIGNVADGIFQLLGTAFFIGDRGFALTAAHVWRDLNPGRSVGLFVDDGNQWQTVPILHGEAHRSEDVAILKLDGTWTSIFSIVSASEYSSCEYEMWGYPEKVAHEGRRMAVSQHEAANLVRPDLIYNRGYVRRRIDEELPVSIYVGKAFYELSEVGGSCCSGGPIVNRKRTDDAWPVFGIYIGEETANAVAAVGYATRFDALSEWSPLILGAPLLSQNLKGS